MFSSINPPPMMAIASRKEKEEENGRHSDFLWISYENPSEKNCSH